MQSLNKNSGNVDLRTHVSDLMESMKLFRGIGILQSNYEELDSYFEAINKLSEGDLKPEVQDKLINYLLEEVYAAITVIKAKIDNSIPSFKDETKKSSRNIGDTLYGESRGFVGRAG